MRIIICGPPHSGKSVFIANLARHLPADSFVPFRIHKDGEGFWSNNQDQEETSTLRIRDTYEEEFIVERCKEMDNITQQVVLVDIGGRIQDDKKPIFKVCDSFIILCRNDKLEIMDKWEALGKSLGCQCMAKIISDLHGTESMDTSDNNLLKGVVTGLERGVYQDNSPLLAELADRILKKADYKPVQVEDGNTLNLNTLLERVAREFPAKYPKPTKPSLRLDSEDAPYLLKEIKEWMKGRTEARVFGAKANWMAALCEEAMASEKVKTLGLFDTSNSTYIPIQKLIIDEEQSSELLKIDRIDSGEDVLVHVRPPEGNLALCDMASIILPKVAPNKPLYLSGRLPLWAQVSILYSYQNEKVFLLQPGNGFICVRSTSMEDLGKRIPLNEKPEFQSFLEELHEYSEKLYEKKKD